MAAELPDLPDGVIEEILLRIPPEEPARLVLASLMSRAWLRVASDPGFRWRYRKFHKNAPPMLGFFPRTYVTARNVSFASFVPTTRWRPRRIPDRRCVSARDCRHGRVLLADRNRLELTVYDPMTGSHKPVKVRRSLDAVGCRHGAAVLCGMAGCDHCACHDGPFRLVLVSTDSDEGIGTARVYSSETEKWSAPTSELDIGHGTNIDPMPSVLAGDALHFLAVGFPTNARVLRYDLVGHRLSVIDVPMEATTYSRDTALMATEDGLLGLAHLDRFKVSVWSRDANAADGAAGAAAWTQRSVIDLETFLPIGNPGIKIVLIGSEEGADIIFVTTAIGIYKVDLNLLVSRKLCGREAVFALFPYMSFYHAPEQRAVTSSSAGSWDP